MKKLLAGFLLLTSVSAFADIEIREGDTYTVTIKKDIKVPMNEEYVYLSGVKEDWGCAISLSTIERFDRVVKAFKTVKGKSKNQVPNTIKLKIYDSYKNQSYSYVKADNNNRAVNYIHISKDGSLATRNQLQDAIKTGCDGYLEMTDYTPSGHEGAVEIE